MQLPKMQLPKMHDKNVSQVAQSEPLMIATVTTFLAYSLAVPYMAF